MAHAETLASSSDLDYIRLYTNSRFVENIHFYASLGYEVGGSVPQTLARLSGWTTGAGCGDNQRAMVAQANAGSHQGC